MPPAAMAMLTVDTRFSSVSWGRSTPTKAAAPARTAPTNLFASPTSWRVRFETAPTCRSGSTSDNPSGPSTWAAASTARSTPTMAAEATSSSALSRCMRSSLAEATVRERSTMTIEPSGATTTLAPSRFPCASRASCNRTRLRQASARVSSLRSS